MHRPDDVPFDERLRRLVEDRRGNASSSPLVAGAIQVIALADVKTELHDKWPRHAGRIDSIAIEEIERELSPQDFYTTSEEHAFTLCLVSLSLAEAKQAAVRISRRIRSRVLLEIPDTSGRIRVDRFVGEVEPEGLLGTGRPLSNALIESLQRMRREAAEHAALRGPMTLRDFRVLFQPIWNVRRNRTDVNRCLIDQMSGAAAIAHLQSLSAREELTEATAHLDGMLFTKSLQAVHEIKMSAGRPLQIMVPVHFSTLSGEGLPGEYLTLVETMPPNYRRSVWLDIHHVPPGAEVLDLLDVLDQVRRYVNRVAFQLSARDPRIGTAMSEVLWGLSTDLSNRRDRPEVLLRGLSRFVSGASEKGLNTLVYGANTLGMAQASRIAGVSYISGSAIHLMADAPKPPSYLNPMLSWEQGSSRAILESYRGSPRRESGARQEKMG